MAAEMNYEQRLIAAARLADDLETTTAKEFDIPSAEEVADKCSEWGVTAQLKAHQAQGLSWLIRRYVRGVNVILGDEMGLGKTLQAISLLAYLKVQRKCPGPFLVLCPLSVTDGWATEFSKFCPRLRVLSYVGDKQRRMQMRKSIFEHVNQQISSSDRGQLLPFDVFLTTYELVVLDAHFLSHIQWWYTIIDEAQRIKNPSSVLYTTLQGQFMIPRRLLLTGTPVQNNLSELWALLHFCMPRIFGEMKDFISTFKQVAIMTPGENTSGYSKQFKLLRYIVHAFMLRRTKALLVKNGTLTLPPLSEVTVLAPLVPLQKKIYVSVLHQELPRLLTSGSGTSQQQSLQNIVVQLRKACSHPYLFNGVEPEPFEEGEHLVQASGKLVILDILLEKLHSQGHRVLIFAQMTRTIDILQDYLEIRRYSYERLDGSVRAEERFSAVQSFSGRTSTLKESSDIRKANNDACKAFVFLISTRAGGVGLNLVGADTVIFYEQDWNPQVDKQALQRAHRIGQLHHVLAISIVTENTVEEVIMHRANRKLQLSHNVIGRDDADLEAHGSEGITSGDLRSIVIYGLHKFDSSEDIERSSSEMNFNEVKKVAEKVLRRRYASMDMDDEKIKLHSREMTGVDSIYSYAGKDALGKNVKEVDLDHCRNADRVAFEALMNKAKDGSLYKDSGDAVRGRKHAYSCEDKKLEEARAEKRRKMEDKKHAKWEAHCYRSLAVEGASESLSVEPNSDHGEVHFVFGDCTNPIKSHPSEVTIIFSYVDNSGNWGSGGMFDALENLSVIVPDAYRKAHECEDLHLGDLHLIPISGRNSDENESGKSHEDSQWVALAVVQTYNPRRKVARSDISLPHLEGCLEKVAISAIQNSASIHMPRIGFRSGQGHKEWYAVERLLHKYAATYGVKIYVYYFKQATRSESNNKPE